MSKKEDSIALFKQSAVRRIWDEEKEKWYFSVVDVVGILTESSRSKKSVVP
jgi:hypothetical protein